MKAFKHNFLCSLSVLLLTCLFVPVVSAQIVEPVKWSQKVESLGDNKAKLVVTATIEPGWHLYSQYNTEGITQQTVFTFEPSKNYTLKGKVKEPKYTELKDDFGNDFTILQWYEYEGKQYAIGTYNCVFPSDEGDPVGLIAMYRP